MKKKPQRFVSRRKIAIRRARPPRIDGKRFRDSLDAPAFRVIQAPDHGDPGKRAWLVVDIAHPNEVLEYTYLCDCVNRKTAQRIAAALTQYVARESFIAEARG